MILTPACLANQHRDPSPPSPLNDERLQPHLWTDETLRCQTLPDGMLPHKPKCSLHILFWFNFSMMRFAFWCFLRFAWSIPSTWCSTVRLKMRRSSCLLQKAGDTGRFRPLSIRQVNWSKSTGACWIISSGATKSLSMTTVSQNTSIHPLLVFLTDTSQAFVWC